MNFGSGLYRIVSRKCHSRDSFIIELLRIGDSSNCENKWQKQSEKRTEERNFLDKGGLCVTINLGANDQSEAVGGLVSARGQRSSWTENRGRTVSALLFIWRAAFGSDMETQKQWEVSG